MEKRALLYNEDVKPRSTGPATKTYAITWSRRALGRFITKQMIARGYFVKKQVVTDRQGPGHYARETRAVVKPGTIIRGFWADNQLALVAEVSHSTVTKLRTGVHKRSPELFTTLKVLKALGVKLVGVPASTDVAMIVKGW